jgi:glycosyltransferase involved in cell wall biosynthesis
MLKIVVDATPFGTTPSGVGLYVFNLIRNLHALQEHQDDFELFIAYQPRLKNWCLRDLSYPNGLKKYPNLYLVPIPVRFSNLFLSISPHRFSDYLERYVGSPDLVHGTNHSVYPCKSSRKVMSIYDLTFLKYPSYVDSVAKKYKNYVKRCLQWTDLVITISKNSKKDIVEYLKVDPTRIYVTPLASRYYPDYLPEELAVQPQTSNEYDFSKPYLLFVSTLEPRKNITSLITAFNLLKQEYEIEHHLVIIGQKGWGYESIFSAIKSSTWERQIHHLDYLSDEMVALFYSKADVFVYPSHYEGFGLPVLEAMTLGAPVITSNTSSLPEVAGDAALLVDPNDPTDLAEAILKVISDSQFRRELIQKGKERAKLFSWERTAKETLKAYKSLLA